MLAAKTLEDIDDPREGNGSEDRDVMNDRTKPEIASPRSVDPAKAKARVGGPQQPEGCDDNTLNEKQRMRPSEPYLTWLGQSLRQSYEETLNESVPEVFRELLNRLEQEDEDKPA
jgi:hypothetical protein